ncbi:MAG: NAD(P)/FAD-dependent oxidoreductase [Acidimicrobiales bacterium]
MADSSERIVIVGASLAGTQAAQTVRRAGYDGRLFMVGEEPHYPYDRPPLSKNYLTDADVDEERLRLRPTADPDALDIEWWLANPAVGLDVEARAVTLADGERLDYHGLVIATGARPRRLPGADDHPDGVVELRTLDDARALRAALEVAEARVVFCGAGFIGAEVAASARERGLDVTLIDAAPAPLDRVLDRAAGMAVADLHRSHGVEVRLEVGVAGFEAAAGSNRIEAVVLGDGSTIAADLVVVGIGVVPNTEWLARSGLTIDNGVVADETCLAGPGIVVAGDVARWPNTRFGGGLMRVEQWDNAVEMGMYAGKRLLSEIGHGSAGEEQPEPFAPVPWFWSDQYDRKIQLAGLTTDRPEVVQGSIDEQRFVQIYLDADDLLAGALCWNRPRQAIVARQMIAAGESGDAARERLA